MTYTIIKPDDQILDYCIYLNQISRAMNDVHRFLEFYEKWRKA